MVGVAAGVALAALLMLRIEGSRRLAAAERKCDAALGRWDAGAYASPQIPDAENAAIVLRAGAEALLLSDAGRDDFGDVTWLHSRSWSEPQRVFLRRVLAENRPALELLRRASGMKNSSFGLRDLASASEEIRDRLPLLKLLQAQRLLYLDAGSALLDGDRGRLVVDAGAMSSMAAALEREAPLISGLVGVAAEKMFLEVVAQVVAEPDIDEATLIALQDSLVKVDLSAAWKRTLALARLAAHLVRPFEGFEAGVAQGFRSAVLADYYEARYAETLCGLGSALDTPFGSSPRVSRSTADVRLPPVAEPSVGLLSVAATRYQTVLSERRLARIALELRLHALRLGAYPDCLARFDAASRPDPFTGGKMTYVHRGDGSARLEVVGGGALWNRANPGVHNPGPFIWELPPPRR